MPIRIGGRLIETDGDLTKLSADDLEYCQDYYRICLSRLPDSPTLKSSLEAIEREIKWRAEDTWFK